MAYVSTCVFQCSTPTYHLSFISFHANYGKMPIRVVEVVLCTIGGVVHEFLVKNKIYHIWLMKW